MKLVIGLVGEKGSGKQTFVNFLKSIAPELNIRQVRFSDILAETLMIWDIPITRSNLQKLSLIMNEAFGQGSLANAAKFSIEGDIADVIIFDGIRRDAELKLVKSMKNSTLIYITAQQNLRYERLKDRSEKVGETGLTFEQFLEEEKSKAETNIPNLGKKADLKIENNDSLEEFKKNIEAYFKKLQQL
ncbi:AAA family ATPase [Candidatus Daviesbacteria bacterium]|nr:AAA family ATPase [Candidatus Daviesbacteria bacterium]